MPLLPYAPVILKLLQGVMYSDDPHWDRLQINQIPIRQYFGQIGLKLCIWEADGFAYLEQYKTDKEDAEYEEGMDSLPRLTSQHPLRYNFTIFCVLLREQLRLFDNEPDTTGQLVLKIEKIRELLEPYFPDKVDNNEKDFRKKVNELVNKAIDLGFLKQMPPKEEEKYEVKRILKAKIDVDTLEKLKEKLENICKCH